MGMFSVWKVITSSLVVPWLCSVEGWFMWESGGKANTHETHPVEIGTYLQVFETLRFKITPTTNA